MKTRRRTNILFGTQCNNNCIFCSDDGIYRKYSIEEIKDQIRNSNSDEIIFVQRESTLREELPELIAFAKNNEISEISISTNGRMLSYEAYLSRLIKKGLTEINISLHGTKQVHDSLTRTPGSFEQTIRGLDNLKDKNVKVLINTTITKSNLHNLTDLIDFLKPYKIYLHVFNFVEPKGRAKRNYPLLVPRFSEVVEVFSNISSEKIKINNLPLCFKKKISEHFGLPENNILPKDLQKDGGRDEMRREKIESCFSCPFEKICEGIYEDYIRIYGWDEFE